MKDECQRSAGFDGMLGECPAMQEVFALVERIAPADSTVLVTGESGTGKEMVAKALHEVSHRSAHPFVVINCAAYPATLLESELFGHEKGAFTGAVQRKIGKFEQAGGTSTIKVNIRIVAATNRHLVEEVKNGNFREDLFYRLNVIPILLPPLRDRKNDVPLLATHFLKKFAAEQHKTIERIDSEAMRLATSHDWPGNIRELENSIEYAVTLAKSDTIFAGDLPASLLNPKSPEHDTPARSLQASEKETISRVLDQCSWNKTAAAAGLGISRSTLYEKLKKHGISSPSS